MRRRRRLARRLRSSHAGEHDHAALHVDPRHERSDATVVEERVEERLLEVPVRARRPWRAAQRPVVGEGDDLERLHVHCCGRGGPGVCLGACALLGARHPAFESYEAATRIDAHARAVQPRIDAHRPADGGSQQRVWTGDVLHDHVVEDRDEARDGLKVLEGGGSDGGGVDLARQERRSVLDVRLEPLARSDRITPQRGARIELQVVVRPRHGREIDPVDDRADAANEMRDLERPLRGEEGRHRSGEHEDTVVAGGPYRLRPRDRVVLQLALGGRDDPGIRYDPGGVPRHRAPERGR